MHILTLYQLLWFIAWCIKYILTSVSLDVNEYPSGTGSSFSIVPSIWQGNTMQCEESFELVCIIKLLAGGYVVVIGGGTWSAGFFFSFTMHWYCAGSENSININVVSLQKFCFTGLLLSCTVLNNLVLTIK